MKYNVEFKVKERGVKWEDIPLAFGLTIADRPKAHATKFADEVAACLSRYNDGAEVRWQYEMRNGFQGGGNYISS